MGEDFTRGYAISKLGQTVWWARISYPNGRRDGWRSITPEIAAVFIDNPEITDNGDHQIEIMLGHPIDVLKVGTLDSVEPLAEELGTVVKNWVRSKYKL